MNEIASSMNCVQYHGQQFSLTQVEYHSRQYKDVIVNKIRVTVSWGGIRHNGSVGVSQLCT